MSAPLVATTSQTKTVNSRRTALKEHPEMNAPSINGNSKSQEADRETSNVMITKARVWLSETLAAKAPVNILGGLALGALLMAAAALPMGTAHADEPVSPLVAAAISPVGYADEFEDVEAGPGSARATFTTVVYVDQFGELEAGK